MEKSVRPVLARGFSARERLGPRFFVPRPVRRRKKALRFPLQETACGGRGSLPEAGRGETHLVGELVGVTLVDRLGGEEEGGTVLGSHRSCRTGGREARGRSATTIGACAPAATGFGQDDAWWPPSGRRPTIPEACDSRVHAGFDGVGNSWNRRAGRSGDGAVEPPGARAVRAAAAEIRRENPPRSRFSKPRIRRAGEAPWPPRAREGRGRRSGRVRDALRARTLTLRKWVKVQMCGNEWLSGATWARGSAFFPVVPHSTSNLV